MNYKLSISVLRPKGLSGFVLESRGAELEKMVLRNKTDNIKKQALNVLTRGLRVTKAYVKHEDLLVIEVQNRSLCDWLNGDVEQKEYVEELDAVFDVLDRMDCRYKFIFREKPYASNQLKSNHVEIVGIKGSAIGSMF